jgi:hypothetical protein
MSHFLRCAKKEQYFVKHDCSYNYHALQEIPKQRGTSSSLSSRIVSSNGYLDSPDIPSHKYTLYTWSYHDQPTTFLDAISTAIADQTRIGWDNALTGMLAYSWLAVAKHHRNQPPWKQNAASKLLSKGCA